MKKIIFLDFDGVMDTAYYDHIREKDGLPVRDEYGLIFDPECVRNLKEIINETGADIVVTSSWRYLMTYKDFLDMWEYRDLPGFVTDVTPILSLKKTRGDEIDAWLNECSAECEYVIIDDLDGNNFNEHQLSRLLVVSPYNGIDSIAAQRAITILNNRERETG